MRSKCSLSQFNRQLWVRLFQRFSSKFTWRVYSSRVSSFFIIYNQTFVDFLSSQNLHIILHTLKPKSIKNEITRKLKNLKKCITSYRDWFLASVKQRAMYANGNVSLVTMTLPASVRPVSDWLEILVPILMSVLMVRKTHFNWN